MGGLGWVIAICDDFQEVGVSDLLWKGEVRNGLEPVDKKAMVQNDRERNEQATTELAEYNNEQVKQELFLKNMKEMVSWFFLFLISGSGLGLPITCHALGP